MQRLSRLQEVARICKDVRRLAAVRGSSWPNRHGALIRFWVIHDTIGVTTMVTGVEGSLEDGEVRIV
jgi:hypothetical protein